MVLISRPLASGDSIILAREWEEGVKEKVMPSQEGHLETAVPPRGFPLFLLSNLALLLTQA